MFRPKKILLPAAAAAIVVAAAIIYFLADPSGSGWFPKCPFLMITGLKCPGCGSQRAIHALLHGDIGAAWRFNAMLVAMIPVILLLLAGELVRTSRPELYVKLNSVGMIVGCGTAIVVWWVVRNIVGI